MAFDDDLKAALRKHFPKEQVKFAKGWRTRGDNWQTPNGRPVASMHHHTAGAATSSTDPAAKGNQTGDNAGVVNWCIAPGQSHGWCNAVCDRDGTIYIVGAKAQWHAGLGTVSGSHWSSLPVKQNMGNVAFFGTEIVSKGTKKDLTKAQKKAMAKLNVALREACGWNGFKYRILNHKDYAPARKNDTLYSWRYWLRKSRAAWLTRTR